MNKYIIKSSVVINQGGTGSNTDAVKTHSSLRIIISSETPLTAEQLKEKVKEKSRLKANLSINSETLTINGKLHADTDPIPTEIKITHVIEQQDLILPSYPHVTKSGKTINFVKNLGFSKK